MIARTADCALAQLGQQGQPVHHRHVDVEQQQLDVGLRGQAPPAPPRRGGRSGRRIRRSRICWRKRCVISSSKSGSSSTARILAGWRSSRAAPRAAGCSCCLQQIEIDRLGDELGGAEFAGPAPALVVAIGRHHDHRQIRARRCLTSRSSSSPSMPGMLMSDRMTISSGSMPSASWSSASSPEPAKCRT